MFACQIVLMQIFTKHSDLARCVNLHFSLIFDGVFVCDRSQMSVLIRPSLSQIQHTDDMENEIDELLQEFEDKSHRPFLHTVCFY